MQITHREKKKVKFRISFIFLFIIASFLACFTLYMKDGDFVVTEEMFEEEQEDVIYIETVGQGTSRVNPVPVSEKQGSEYYNDAVFIGSKSLAGLSDYGFVEAENMLLSDSIKLSNINTVIISENDVQNTIADAVISKKAKKVYIMIGLYELSNIDETSIFNELEGFIEAVHDSDPEVEIYLMSVLPLPAEIEATVASNADIDAFNSLLLKFADKEQVSYLDVNTSLKGNDGKLPASAAEINGTRLTKEMYGFVSDYILSHVAK